jgi:hypothetical protein
MLNIINKSKSIKVLKAMDLHRFRLFPGSNMVESKELFDKYIENNKVAKDMCEKYIEVKESFSPQEKILAEKSKQKNDMLNKGQRPPTKVERPSIFSNKVK